MREFSLAVLVLVAACSGHSEGRFFCSEGSDCPPRWTCSTTENLCYPPLVDASMHDASDGAVADGSDGAVVDAGISDGSTDGGPVLIPAMTTCATQGDLGTRSFPIAAIRIPSPTHPVGFNIDGRISTTNADIAGCRQADVSDGTDNALMECLGPEGLGDLFARAGVDVNEELMASIASNAIDLDVVLTDWNLSANDGCVVVTIRGENHGEQIIPIVGRAALANGMIGRVTFDSKLLLTPTFAFSPDGGVGACMESCVTVPLPFALQNVTARLKLSADLMNLVVDGTPNNTNSSSLGGYVRYIGTDGDAFQPALGSLVNAIKPSLVPSVDAIVSTYLDLDSTPTLRWCESTGSTTTTADTFSAAFLISSTP